MQIKSCPNSEIESESTPPSECTPVERGLVLACLDRICTSAEFARSEQMARFLRILVEHRLSGEATRLNERAIGTRVFGKGLDWDPREDTIVRTEARRLRTKLYIYYLTSGETDAVRISLPKGGYSVQLEIHGDDREEARGDSGILFPDPVSSVHSSTTRRQQKLWMFASAASLIVAILILWRLAHTTRAVANSIESFEIAPLADEIGQEYSPAVSPDGKRVAYVWDGNGNNLDIYVKDIAGGPALRITTDHRPDLYPSWSPDGKTLAYVRKGDVLNDVLVRSVAGGPERMVGQIAMEFGHWADDDSPLLGDPGPAWTHDGKHLIVSDVAPHAEITGLYSISLENGTRELLTGPPGETRDFYPKVSPDGRTLAFVRYLTHGVGHLYLLPLDPLTARPARKPEQITSDHETIRGIGWAVKGGSLLFASNLLGQFQLWSIDITTRHRTTVATDTSSVADPSEVPHSSELVFTKFFRNWNIWQASLANGVMGTAHRLLSSSGLTRDPCYSPDGTRIAFVSDRSGEMQIYVAAADGSQERQLTHMRSIFTSAPVWSPDSKWLAFDARPEGHSGIYIVRADGGVAVPLNQTEAEERAPFWSHDGHSIYFNSNRSGVVAIWKKTLPNGTPVQIAGANSFLAQESTDGRRLYFSDIHGNLFESNPNGSGAHSLPLAVHATPVSSWIPTKRGLYFTAPLPNGHSQIYWYDGNSIEREGETAAPLVVNAKDISVSPDGTSILFAEQDFVGSDIVIRRPHASQ